MEAVLMHGSYDQTISPYKSHIGNPNRIIHRRPFINSRPSENLFPPHDLIHHAMGGLLQPPPPPFLSHSYPPYSQALQQPPLLPLPAAAPRLSTAARGHSCPPAANKLKKANNNGNSPPKKSKSPTKKEEKRSSPKKYCTANIHVSSVTGILGPDPKEQLPKDVGNVLPLSTAGNLYSNGVNSDSEEQKVDVFSGTVAFAISPPPSSLPLPTFSLRRKLGSCKAEAAAGIDTGATDNLRRLLRLR